MDALPHCRAAQDFEGPAMSSKGSARTHARVRVRVCAAGACAGDAMAMMPTPASLRPLLGCAVEQRSAFGLGTRENQNELTLRRCT